MPKRKKQFKNIAGMPDLLKDDLSLFEKIERITGSLANFYDFSKVDTPILEDEELFVKGTGEGTDVVQKEMYSFTTKGKERVVLRPEFTPAIIRAYIQHGMENLPKPVKLWSVGPLFRHERPQKGRLRQFNQFNFEVLGSESPAIDALLIQLFSNLLYEVGLKNWNLEVNSIGCKDCRPRYLRQLKNYYRSKSRQVCPNCKKKILKNPLRVLDCKEEKCQRIKKFAPQIVNYLCESCYSHFKEFLELLDAMEIHYFLNPYLVRGLDYYEKTVFEFIPEGKERVSQNTLIGGGRYDSLVEMLGGKPTPGIGGAGGIERIIEEIKENKTIISSDILKKNINYEEKPFVFIVQLGDLARKKSLQLIEDFKKAKIKIAENIGKDNLKAQLGQAARKQIKYTLILGQQECINEQIILRNMETGVQEIVSQKEIVKKIKKRLK
jgi:histidyl-tRNA synthetase